MRANLALLQIEVIRDRLVNNPTFRDAFSTYCGTSGEMWDPPHMLRSLADDDLFPDVTLRTMDTWHSHKGAELDNVADEMHIYITVGSPAIFDKAGEPLLKHKSNSNDIHYFSQPFGDSWQAERVGIPMLKDDLPRGRFQNTQQRAGGGTPLMRRCTEGNCTGVYWVYYIASHKRKPGEEGNLPAPRAFIGTPAGNLMKIDDGERGARRFFRKGLRHVLEVLAAYDTAQ